MRNFVTAAMMGIAMLAAGTGPAAAAGLPQLDPTKFSTQIVWLVISFVALYFLMVRVALPRVGEVLDERQHKIDESLKKAEQLKTEAEAVAEAYEKNLAEARAGAQDAIRTVREKAANEAAARQTDLAAKLSGDIKEAEASILEARDQALSGIRDMAADVARAASTRLLGEELDEQTVGGHVDAVMGGRD